MADFGFVSCDIIGHSSEPDPQVQVEHVKGLNEVVSRFLHVPSEPETVWASGGDGGHIGLRGNGWPVRALELIDALKDWATRERVRLRVTAHQGEALAISGADGRAQLVGPGINFAGHLLLHGNQDRVVVSGPFEHALSDTLKAGARNDVYLHGHRHVDVRYFGTQLVALLSFRRKFESRWDTGHDDRLALQSAVAAGNVLEAIYRAKRLLSVNRSDQAAIKAMHALSEAVASEPPAVDPKARKFLELLLEPTFGLKVMEALTLVERAAGDVLFRQGDPGDTMFFMLRGRVDGFFQTKTDDASPNSFAIQPGQLLGELAFALRSSRTATMVCAAPVALLSFDYREVESRANRNPTGSEIKKELDRLIRARLVEHAYNACDLLRGPEGKGPLSGIDYRQLLVGCRYKRVSIKKKQLALRGDGLWLLLDGAVEGVSTRTKRGKSVMLLRADLPAFSGGPMTVRLLEDCQFLFVSQEALDNLDEETRLSLVKAVRDALAGFRYDVFLSYSSQDRPIVSGIAKRLQDDGLRVWFDDQIREGESIVERIEEGLQRSRVLVLCMSRSALASEWSRREANTFVFSDPLNKKRRLIPLRLDDAPISGSLSQFRAIEWSNGDAETAYSQLLRACRESLES